MLSSAGTAIAGKLQLSSYQTILQVRPNDLSAYLKSWAKRLMPHAQPYYPTALRSNAGYRKLETAMACVESQYIFIRYRTVNDKAEANV